jgi:hypothetical protein
MPRIDRTYVPSKRGSSEPGEIIRPIPDVNSYGRGSESLTSPEGIIDFPTGNPMAEYASIQSEDLVRYFNSQCKAFARSVFNVTGIDFDTSIKPYALKLKHRWTQSNSGIVW